MFGNPGLHQDPTRLKGPKVFSPWTRLRYGGHLSLPQSLAHIIIDWITLNHRARVRSTTTERDDRSLWSGAQSARTVAPIDLALSIDRVV
jgi:hypothetical protein